MEREDLIRTYCTVSEEDITIFVTHGEGKKTESVRILCPYAIKEMDWGEERLFCAIKKNNYDIYKGEKRCGFFEGIR